MRTAAATRKAALAVAAAVVVLSALLLWAVGTAVERYCAHLEAALLAARGRVYRRLAWPVPVSTVQEAELGGNLTTYLTRVGEFTDVDLVWPDPGD
jgi:hypothetical protein